jgi:salicylate hydroxylase
LHIQYSKRLRSYRRLPSGQLELNFQDGSHATCDVLVGADGIKSVVRRDLLHDQAEAAIAGGNHEDAKTLLDSIDLSWIGTVAYRFLVPLREISTDQVPNCPTQVCVFMIYLYPLIEPSSAKYLGKSRVGAITSEH